MGLVYSTAGGRVGRCPRCGRPLQDGRCDCARRERALAGDGVVRVRRETGGRRGKTVTTISGTPGTEAERRALAKRLKALCGTGGTVSDGVIELQGDHRTRVIEHLRGLGLEVKSAGG
jgi:translation initiation factor 1